MPASCIEISLPPYLAQWLIYENGDSQPILLPRLSTENRLLEVCLIRKPKNLRESGDISSDEQPTTEESVAPTVEVAIVIPSFKYKPAEKFNYLPRAAKAELVEIIRNRFIIQFWNDLHRLSKIGERKDQLIEAWMEANGIEVNDTNFNSLLKIYQRQYGNYRVRKHRRKNHVKKG